MKHSPNFQKAGQQPYDPKYDPIMDKGPGHNMAYAPTYWVATAGKMPEDDGPVTADMDVDVVVIGSGYTGLSTAIHLAKDHGIKAHVLEANGIGWGCSSRSGGQAQISSGRLKRSQWIARWGLDTAREMHAEVCEAFQLFRDLLSEHKLDVDACDGGHYYLAHKGWMLPKLKAEVEVLNNTFGYKARMLSREQVHAEAIREMECHGASWEPDGIAVQPAKLAFEYARVARELGVKLHPASPVTGWETKNGIHYLRTPGGTVRARAVCVATSAYVPRNLHPLTKNRLMPILSNNCVTRQLTPAEIEQVGAKVYSPLTDTRTLRFYYRMLPEGRIQIGSRSAITGRDAPMDKHFQLLKNGLAWKFPHLKGIEIDYSWWGWVDVSHDMMPRITQPDPKQTIYYALGYGGNGVMYSAQAGRRMAQMVAGKADKLRLPIFTSQLPHEGWKTPFRRFGQYWLYHWYHMRDERN